jgi:hypothetical protein
MLSEGIHPVVDTIHQDILLFGNHRAEREPDERYPFGSSFFSHCARSAATAATVRCGVSRARAKTRSRSPHFPESGEVFVEAQPAKR